MWNSFGDFLQQGGHGFYVWSSYGVALGLVALEVLRHYVKAKQHKRRLLSLARVQG